MNERHVGTLVIGAGQAGLAIGYRLRRRGLPFVIVDENERVGNAWRKRWDSLRLFTPAPYNGLPGMPFPGPSSLYPTKDQTADYLEAHARTFELPVRTGVSGSSFGRSRPVRTVMRRGSAAKAAALIRAFSAMRLPFLSTESNGWRTNSLPPDQP